MLSERLLTFSMDHRVKPGGDESMEHPVVTTHGARTRRENDFYATCAVASPAPSASGSASQITRLRPLRLAA
jgi:hypothetical protein